MTVAITAMMVSCTSSKPTSTNPPAGVNAGTDGKDLGADVVGLNAALIGVE